MRIRLAPPRLFGRVALLIMAVAIVQFVATLLLYSQISRATVREDHARRVAELLEVSKRLDARDEDDLAEIMSTVHLQVWLTTTPAVSASSPGAATVIKTGVQGWEPTLAKSELHLDVERRGRREHLIGSMELEPGRWLNFRSMDLSRPWPIIASATLITLSLAALCIALAALALWQMGAPLRRMTEATRRVGEGQAVVLEEEGPSDLRNLARAFNQMQGRIAQILKDQTSGLIGLSHDLRTPLSRLRLSTDFIEPTDIRELVNENVCEMQDLIVSLQDFLNAQQLTDEPAEVRLTDLIKEASGPWSDKVSVQQPLSDRTVTYPLVLARALAPLIQNAVQYGGRAVLSVTNEGGTGPVIQIDDPGPGISEEHIPQLTQPFFRVDAARPRDTGGFGLGIPTAQRLLQRFGGELVFSRSDLGGLRVSVRPPSCLDAASSPAFAPR